MLHACCGSAYVKYIKMVITEEYKGILLLVDGNRPEDLSVYYSLTEKNNAILDYYGV